MRAFCSPNHPRLLRHGALLLALAALFSGRANAQTSITSNVIAGGGGRISGSSYTVDGTIGDPIASGTLAGGALTLDAGFENAVSPNPPTVTIFQAVTQDDPTDQSPINFTVEFSEPVTGFATGDVALSGTAGATTGTVTGGGATYNVAVSGMTSTGSVSANVPAGTAVGIGSGMPNQASPFTGDRTVNFSIAPFRRNRGQITSQ